MLFWLFTIARYLVAVVAAFLSSIIISLLFMVLFYGRGDDSPALGILWFLSILFAASLLIPLSLGVTAEIIDRKIHARPFKWLKALWRFLLALPISLAPLYAIWCMFHVESSRPAFWIEKEVALCCISAIFAYLALRIGKRTTHPVQDCLTEG